MKLFKAIYWCEGVMDSPLFEKEFKRPTVAEAVAAADEDVEKAKQSFPLFDFGLKEIIEIQNENTQ